MQLRGIAYLLLRWIAVALVANDWSESDDSSINGELNANENEI